MSIEIIKLNGNTIIDVTQVIPVANANWELSNNGAGTIYLSDTLPVDSTDFARVLNVNNPTLVYPIAVNLYAWADKGVSASLSFSSSVEGVTIDIATDQDILEQVVDTLIDAPRIVTQDIINVDSSVRVPSVNAVKAYVGTIVASGLKYRGTLDTPATFYGTTSNTYLNNATDVKSGDVFIALNTGVLTMSDGNKNVSKGDALLVNTDSPKNAVTRSMLDDISPTYPAIAISDYKRAAVSYNAGAGWVLCEGQAISRTTYAILFSVIGETFGLGDGSTTFNVPDPRGRVAVGAGQGTGLTNRIVGQVFGTETVTLTEAQLPSHLHTINHDHPSFNSGNGGTNTQNGQYGLIRKSNGNSNTTNGSELDSTPGEPDLISDVSGWVHTHPINIPNYNGNSGSTGSGQAHNNTQASFVDGYLFIYAGV